jgi:hypothetical protein
MSIENLEGFAAIILDVFASENEIMKMSVDLDSP